MLLSPSSDFSSRFSSSFILSSSIQITIEAMKSDIDEVALQGIEFWSNVCDEEMDLAIEASEVCVSRLYYINNFKKSSSLLKPPPFDCGLLLFLFALVQW